MMASDTVALVVSDVVSESGPGCDVSSAIPETGASCYGVRDPSGCDVFRDSVAFRDHAFLVVTSVLCSSRRCSPPASRLLPGCVVCPLVVMSVLCSRR